MISKAKIKYIRSLEQKKSRKAEGVFVAEGPKVVGDLMVYCMPKIIVATKEWIDKNTGRIAEKGCEIIEVTDDELKKVSFLQHPQQVLAVFPQNFKGKTIESIDASKNLVIALDGVQDPGNLGTIIRIADWFGIENIVCSIETADVWNPKVIQATMGSIARINVAYCNLTEYIKSLPEGTPVYGTLLDGKDIYTTPLTDNGVIVMGNEGNGITEEVRKVVSHKLLIPNFPKGRETADSLNVAIATAITCSEFRRITAGNC